VEVLVGSARQEVVLHVHRGLYIRGRVLDPAGTPAPGYVWGHTDAAAWMLSAQAGKDGAFAVGPLIPGRYTLVAHGWGHADSESVEASGGDEDVVLRLRTGGSVRGTIIDGVTGKSCAAELIFVVRGRGDGGFSSMNSAEDGVFEVGGLAAGIYDFAARASGYRAGSLRGVSVQAGVETRDLVLTLRPGAKLRILYAGKHGYLNYQVLSEGMTVASDGIAAGRSAEAVVPSGHLVVECHWPSNGSETKEIDVAVGEEKELVFGGGG
jgi:hypothetical protein